MNRKLVVRTLRSMGVPPKLLERLPHLTSDVEGLLVYGCQARGDAVLDSERV